MTKLIILAVVIVLVLGSLGRKKMREGAKKEYEDALQRLKQDPNNPELRGEALRLGRAYSSLTRRSRRGSRFDEVALMNDINAACARATVGQNGVGRVEVTNPTALSGTSVTQEIEGLGKLFLAGAITAEEFERGKTLFLGAPPDKAASAVQLLQNLDALKKQGVLSEAEFRMKKWEILSERLIPGKMEAGRLPQ
jgi:hypothetical protein